DVGIEPTLVADMAAGQRAATRMRNVLDIEITQAGLLRVPAECLDPPYRVRRAPEAAASEMDRPEARPAVGQPHRPGDAAAGRAAADDAQRAGRREGRG